MIQYELDDHAIAIITIDHPEEPLNILSFQAIGELEEVLDHLARLESPQPVGVVFISGKPDNFVVGVDIKDFLGFQTIEDGAESSRTGQSVFGKIGQLPFPSVAAINGTCLGGGLELALNCTSRIITDHPKTALGLPEVKLGLLPGASGSQYLPRLVGVRKALDMMLTGKNIYPYPARKMGLADEIVSPGVLLQAAKAQVVHLSGGASRAGLDKGQLPKRPKRALIARLLDGPLKGLVFRGAKKQVLATTRGHYPAPLEIIKVVKQGLRRSLAGGLKVEALGFGRLTQTPEHRALTHVFFAGRGSKTTLKTQPRPLQQVGILGAGLMGSGIATICLDKGLTVRHKDIGYEVLGQARGHIQRYFDERVKRHIVSRRDADLTLTLYSPTTGYVGFGRSQIIIEAVFEDLALKRELLAALEGAVSQETVLATNTSSLPIGEIATGAKHPERIIGMHFFSPVEKMPLVEIITSRHTDEQTLATTVALGKRMGKTVIVVQDSPGFYVNRILTPYLSEAFQLLEDGLPADVLDGYAQRMGFPVGPCTLIDEVGLDVAGKVSDVMAPFIGERLQMTDHNHRFTDDGRLGRKNGRGFYTYPGGKKGSVDTTVYQLFDHPQRRKIPYEQVRERLLAALLNEAAYCLDEGLIDSPSVGDVGAIYGFGFPPFLGGPYWAMDQLGLPAFVEQLHRLAEQHGSRFTPAPDLVKKAEAGERYYAGA